MLARLRPHAFSLASPQSVREAICHQFAETFARGAVEGLASRHPDRSARERLALWHRVALALGLLIFLAAMAIAPAQTIWLTTLLLVMLFVPVIGLRLVAAYLLLRGEARATETVASRVHDAELPVYTILVPLYREAHMLAPLVHGLTRLDWPAAKLDIKLILEAVDVDTIAAARALNVPGNVEIVVVPELQPRTKPKALNYALPLARGEYLVIFDAEDRPDRDQLRRAFAAFRRGSPNLACVQAALNIYNARDVAHAAIHTRILRAVRRALAGSGQASPACSAWGHLEPFPHVGAEMADGVGPVQRYRGCRSRHASRAERLSLRDASLDHL
jgi:hypothetical protein